MGRLLFKFIGTLIGVGLVFLAMFWMSDPKSGAGVLLAGGVLILIGTAKSEDKI